MLTTNFSSSSLVSTILFGMLFAWLLVTAVMTFRTGTQLSRNNRGGSEKGLAASSSDTPPVQNIMPATASTADEATKPSAAEPAPFPLTRGRRAEQHVGPETASIAASADSR